MKPDKNRARGIGFYMLIGVIILAVVFYLTTPVEQKEYTYSEIETLFREEKVKSFSLEGDELTLNLYSADSDGNTTIKKTLPNPSWFREDLGDLIDAQTASGVLTEYDYVKGWTAPWWMSILPYLITVVLFIGVWYLLMNKSAGGFTWYRKAEDAEDFTSRGEMFDSIVSALGGRIAEQLFLDDISTGASGDIQQATSVARDMVMKYGMSEKLGPISFDDSSHSIFIGRDFGTTKSYSEETAATIDEEVKHIFDQAYAKCEALLREHADLLTGLAEYLLIHETIEGDDFRYYCEHGQMPIHPDDTIEPPAKVIRRMDEAPVAPQPEAPSAPDADAPNSDPGEQP